MIKLIYRFIKHLAILLLISIPLQLMGGIILLIWLPIQRKLQPTKVMLPSALKWFDNADIYSELHRSSETYVTTVWPQGWWAQYTWLAWRNPLNYFGYIYLGLKIDSLGSIITNITNITFNTEPVDYIKEIGDGTGQYPGLQITEVVINNKTYYEYYYIKKYKWKQETKCIRIRIGYKIGKPEELQINDYIQQVFVISPFHSYNGR